MPATIQEIENGLAIDGGAEMQRAAAEAERLAATPARTKGKKVTEKEVSEWTKEISRVGVQTTGGKIVGGTK